jgi:hypothetical protein
MAVYKVPQDVEADDKLIGPFTFRQFIYLIIVALSLAMAWGLSQLLLPLALLPLPVTLVFGALALPLRKDQPMEVYAAAIVSFYLKPRKRFWSPDGMDSLVEITAPKTIEATLTKDLSQEEAQKRFSYLADIVDTQGWAVRGGGAQAPNSPMISDIYFAAQQVEDVLDESNSIAVALDKKIDQSIARTKQNMTDIMQGKNRPTSFNPFEATAAEPMSAPAPVGVRYNPYPEDMRQAVLKPIGRPYDTPPPEKPIDKTPDADIINLANSSNLSVETIAREAKRIQDKKELSEEVIISLR